VAKAGEYPNVICAEHPETVEPGYAVCNHVASGEKPIHRFVAPTKSRLGEIACEQCGADATADDLILVCAHCVRRNGWRPQ
jgi:hypothetical protein